MCCGWATTEARPQVGLERSHQGRLDHSRDLAPSRHSLAPTHGGARPAPAGHSGSGRSQPAGPRIRIRLEAQARAKDAIQLPRWVQNSSPTSVVETVENRLTVGSLGYEPPRPSDLNDARPRCGITQLGRCDEFSERARTSVALPAVARPHQPRGSTSTRRSSAMARGVSADKIGIAVMAGETNESEILPQELEGLGKRFQSLDTLG